MSGTRAHASISRHQSGSAVAGVSPAPRRGQTLVEFALIVGVFLFMIMGILDFGRAIFLYNGVSEAARDLSRVTSLHPGSPLGSSPETATAWTAEQGMIGGLTAPVFACVDLAGGSISGACRPGDRVTVKVEASYSAITPLLSLLAPITVSASSTVTLQ